MRFLLFNLVVVGALYYLFTADTSDVQNAAANAHAVVDRVERATTQAVETVDAVPETIRERLAKASGVQDAPVPPRPETFEPKIVAHEPPPLPEPAEDVAEAPPAREMATEVAEVPVVKPIPELPPRPTTEQTPPPAPKMLAAEELPVTEVAARQVHKADPATARPARQIAAAPPAIEAGPAPRKSAEVAIAEGETLMSPSQRRKELYALAEDMEMFFIDRAGK